MNDEDMGKCWGGGEARARMTPIEKGICSLADLSTMWWQSKKLTIRGWGILCIYGKQYGHQIFESQRDIQSAFVWFTKREPRVKREIRQFTVLKACSNGFLLKSHTNHQWRFNVQLFIWFYFIFLLLYELNESAACVNFEYQSNKNHIQHTHIWLCNFRSMNIYVDRWIVWIKELRHA